MGQSPFFQSRHCIRRMDHKKGQRRVDLSSFNKKAAETVTIDWKPNKNLDVPLYAQIVTYFTDNISTGNWTGGQNVPSSVS